MDRILLLGAGGFLGRPIGRALRDAGVGEVVAVVRRAPTGAPPDRIEANLADPGAVRAMVAAVRPTVIVNAAGSVDGDAAQLALLSEGLAAALVEALRADGSGARLIHLGSSSEYGPGVEGTAMAESHPTQPASDYGRSKLRASAAILDASASVPAIVLRIFNPIGAGSPPGSVLGAAVASMRAALASGAGEVQLGALDAYRDFIHVADVADAVRAAVDRPEASGIVNVGSGTATLVRSLIHELADVAGYRGEIVESAARGSGRSRPVSWQQADVTRAADVLGWVPTRQRREALVEAWAADPDEGADTNDR